MFTTHADAKAQDLLAWMVGAGITVVGLGSMVSARIRRFAPWILAVGIGVHGWGMYRIYKRA
jgi:hypothetical protein